MPGHEITQSCHFRLGQRVHVPAGNAVRSGYHFNVGVYQAVIWVDVLIHWSIHILHIVIPHWLVSSVSVNWVVEGRLCRRWENWWNWRIHPAVVSAVFRIKDDRPSAPGDVGIVCAQPAHPQDDGEEWRLGHIKRQHFTVFSQVDYQVVGFVDNWARCYGMSINRFHKYWPVLDS
ncbi:hypothetical protein HJG60_008494 [Phyllostomus discolor]|uniref:Uncharacterized protein n=1 Tax=Phyllostomus discolor TaxID=89673 RepID=A0A834DQH3_9CHIR|nr:hypothetical protein HJG60_008494 [Phyllostomus discolor]